MAYPPPPGTSSLPARPPISAHSRPGFKPAFGSAQSSAPPPPPSYLSAQPPPASRPSGPSHPAPPAVTQHYGSSYSPYPGRPAAGMNPSSSSSTPAYSYPQQQQSYAPRRYGQPTQYGAAAAGPASASVGAPQIKNPFPTPGQGGNDFDPEMAAQIAQWQSAYVPRETDKDGRPTVGIEYPKPEIPDPAAQPERKKTVAREGGGKKWTDDSLLDWDPNHLRLFVGNLAGETTDESLLKAFSRWKSVQKARVVRDKRTTKSKGFGFVSFSDADDFFQAAKEMNGKYIQSHPVVVKKATTEIKVTNAKDKTRQGKNKNKNNSKFQGNGGGNQGDKKKGWDQGAGGYEPYLGPAAGGGITKPGQKTKNGLRLLG